MNMIFNILGTPTGDDVDALEKEDAKRYIRMFHTREGIDFGERFRAASPDALDVLQRMLVFNPAKRISVDEALAHDLFADIRNPSIETTATDKVTLPFDDWQGMAEPQLRYAFLREVQRYHSDVTIPTSISQSRQK
eukprot:Polyplicarium_translucidae@DN3359_c0_g1_i5.p2